MKIYQYLITHPYANISGLYLQKKKTESWNSCQIRQREEHPFSRYCTGEDFYLKKRIFGKEFSYTAMI